MFPNQVPHSPPLGGTTIGLVTRSWQWPIRATKGTLPRSKSSRCVTNQIHYFIMYRRAAAVPHKGGPREGKKEGRVLGHAAIVVFLWYSRRGIILSNAITNIFSWVTELTLSRRRNDAMRWYIIAMVLKKKRFNHKKPNSPDSSAVDAIDWKSIGRWFKSISGHQWYWQMYFTCVY